MTASTTVILLVELGDHPHRQYRRRRRDGLVNRVCGEAELRIIHIKARASYQPAIIRRMIEDRLWRPA